MTELSRIAVVCCASLLIVGFSGHAAERRFGAESGDSKEARSPPGDSALEAMRPSAFERGKDGHAGWSRIRGQSLIRIDPRLLRNVPEEAVRLVLDRTKEATGAPDGVQIEVIDQSESFPKEISFRQLIDGARVGGSGTITFDRHGNVQDIDIVLIDPQAVGLIPASISAESAVFTAREALKVHLDSNDIGFVLLPGPSHQEAVLVYREAEGAELHPYWIVELMVDGPGETGGLYSVEVDAVSSEAEVLSQSFSLGAAVRFAAAG